MKASELIKRLQEIVNEYEDTEIEVNGAWDTGYPLDTTSRLTVNQVDIFVDSDNIQILLDNSI